MTRAHLRLAAAVTAALATLAASPAFAQTPNVAAKIDAADTAWMLGATGLVLMMTIPGLALFYAGMVRKKNVLATMAQCMAATFLVSILWAVFGYSLTFTGDGAYIGTLDRVFLNGMTLNSISPFAKTIPESLFMIYQMTFAVITVALVAGSVADRMRFSAFLLFCVFWLLLVYVPIAHWVWGGGFLGSHGVIDFAGGLVVHLNAGIAGLVAATVIGKRRGYGSENLSPHDLTLAVIGTGLLWVGWFGFNGGSGPGAHLRAAMAITSTHLAASAGAFTWMVLEWWMRGKPSVLGMISGAVAGIGGLTGTFLAGVLAVGALSVSPEMPHGVSGLLEGNPRLVLDQLYGIVVTLAWSGIMTFVVLKIVGAIVPLRVRHEDEVMGLDVSQHGEALQ